MQITIIIQVKITFFDFFGWIFLKILEIKPNFEDITIVSNCK